jgi:hypothetical protein
MSDTPNIIPIPGGRARLRDPGTLPERYRRPLKSLATLLGDKLEEVARSAQGPDDSVARVAADVGLSETDVDRLMRLTDAVIYALLESWTLTIPVPTTLDAVQDMPGDVYDALATGTAKHAAALLSGAGTDVTPAGEVVDTFTVAAVEDDTSPIGASAG